MSVMLARRAIPHGAKLEQAIAEIISSGDLIGRGEKGEAFLLVTLDPQTFAQLCLHGAEAEDAEEDDPLEANGDEGDHSTHVTIADQAIIDLARARRQQNAAPRPFRTKDPRTGRAVEFVPVGGAG